MNAASFFNESDYERLKDIVEREEVIECLDTPFRRKHKTNGNSYELTIYTGHYAPTIYNGAYCCSCWYDYNYKGIYDSRDIGGGVLKLVLSTYEEFKKSINNILQKFPDYKESEEPAQIRFF